MALLAEQIVEEWLTRQGYFTIRGLRIGVHEIDLLAVKSLGNEQWEKLHIEVQVSHRPVAYISQLTQERQKEFNIKGSANATVRTDQQLKVTVDDWIKKKYLSENKKQLRMKLSNSDDWKYLFVHGVVKSPQELKYISEQNIQIKNIKEILLDLRNKKCGYTTGSATDIMDLMELGNK